MGLGRVWYGAKYSHGVWERFAHICGNRFFFDKIVSHTWGMVLWAASEFGDCDSESGSQNEGGSDHEGGSQNGDGRSQPSG